MVRLLRSKLEPTYPPFQDDVATKHICARWSTTQTDHSCASSLEHHLLYIKAFTIVANVWKRRLLINDLPGSGHSNRLERVAAGLSPRPEFATCGSKTVVRRGNSRPLPPSHNRSKRLCDHYSMCAAMHVLLLFTSMLRCLHRRNVVHLNGLDLVVQT